MKQLNKNLWIIIATVFASLSVVSQSRAEESLDTPGLDNTKLKIEQVVNQYVANSAFEGAILVSKSGDVIFEKAYGLSDRAKNQPMTTKNTFQLASLSKPITATMVLMLEQQGKLKLDNTLVDYFPEFNNAVGKKITLHHLLSHTSGIPNHFVMDGWFDDDYHRQTSEQDFIGEIANLVPEFEPGADYLYSNPGYFLLGKIIEKVTDTSYSANLQQHIFSPLQMQSSGVSTGFQLAPSAVKGYRWNNQGGYREQVAKNMTLFGAGAAIFSNVGDLYRFDLALYGDKLINKKSKERLFDPEQAYSWQVGQVPMASGLKVNVHMYDGQIDGYSSMMTRFIDDKHSIIILSNVGMSYVIKQQLTFDIASVLYNQDPINRENDVSLLLMNSMVSGTFEKAVSHLQADKGSLDFNEQSLSALAYQLLWSNLADKSLQLFSLINNKFPDSPDAKKNLKQACDHRLAKASDSRAGICI